MPLKHLQKGFLEFIYEFNRGIQTHDIILAYEGEITHALMKVFTGIAVGRMPGEQESKQVQKKVYHVLVECLQNTSKHAYRGEAQYQTGFNHGILIISRNPEDYLITTGNLVEIGRIADLATMLEKINLLNKKELDKLYKQQIMEGSLSEKGGAGLGFIDIRRKTGQKLEFHFLPVNQDHSFFLFTSRIVRNNNLINTDGSIVHKGDR